MFPQKYFPIDLLDFQLLSSGMGMGRQTPRAGLHWKGLEPRNHPEAARQMPAAGRGDGAGPQGVAREV